MNEFLVTVLIAIYNPPWKKLRATLNSVVAQKGIPFDIVICDDCSRENYQDQVSEYMAEKGFSEFKYVRMPKNGGTVQNILNGLRFCEGRYVKTIGQGDLLHNADILCNMYRLAIEAKLKAVAGSYQSFVMNGDCPELVSGNRMPQNMNKCHSSKDAFIQYVVCHDIILGATVLYEKECLQKYLTEMSGKVIYSEDFATRLMIADGLSVDFYRKPVVYYERGTGVSFSGAVYGERLEQGKVEYIKMLIERYSDNKHLVHVFKIRINMIEHYSKRKHLHYLLSDYHILLNWLRRKFFPIKTSTEWQNDFFQQCYRD